MNAQTGEFPRFSRPTTSPISGLTRFLPEAAIATVIIMTLVSTIWGGYREVSDRPTESQPPVAMAPAVIASIDRRVAHNGRYASEVVSATPFVTYAAQTWTIHVDRRNRRPLGNGSIVADVWMPESGEHLPAQPRVRYVGDGNYRIDNFSFPRPGWWNVALVVKGSAGVDSLAFNLILPPIPTTN